MSNDQIQNEDALWDVLNEPVTTETKESKRARPEPRPKPAPKAAEPEPVKPAGKSRRIDGFFLACMAGVAAVSVTATLLISTLAGGGKPPAAAADPVETTAPIAGETLSDTAGALEQENAELRAQLELQKEQIRRLQAELLDLSGGSAELPTVSADSGADNELVNEQLEAYEIFTQIKAAYEDFDRETLEKLIPEMDKRLSFLSSEALDEYYLILEYVEQPSNG